MRNGDATKRDWSAHVRLSLFGRTFLERCRSIFMIHRQIKSHQPAKTPLSLRSRQANSSIHMEHLSKFGKTYQRTTRILSFGVCPFAEDEFDTLWVASEWFAITPIHHSIPI